MGNTSLSKLKSGALSRSRTKSPGPFEQIRSQSVDGQDDLDQLGGMDEDDESEIIPIHLSNNAAPIVVHEEYQDNEQLLELRQQSMNRLKERGVVKDKRSYWEKGFD